MPIFGQFKARDWLGSPTGFVDGNVILTRTRLFTEHLCK